jgi:thiol-disulfide isomerase/thioredoxin
MEITPDTFEPLDLVNIVNEKLCVVIRLSASWCGPCKSKEFKENYNSLKEKFSKSSNIIKFIELDIEEFEDLINDKEYYDINVKTIPYFKLSYKGSWGKDFSGTSCIPEIDEALVKIANKYYSEQEKQEKQEN